MKLLNLELQAFGSFKNKESIDFTLFDTNRLFLISGKTGSGKTTIFDAISYALFGKLTGQFKSDDMLRSHYATDNDETYVKLKFKEQNKEYLIYRRPTYKLTTKKEIKSSITLTNVTEDKVLSTKTTDANKQIEDILKFSHEQFKQIVVLPQGEFIKILNSSSNDKEKLLSSLLNTSIYNKIIDKLREENNKLESKLANVKAVNDTILNKHKVNNLDELYNLKNDIKIKYDEISLKYNDFNNNISNLKLDIQNYTYLNELKIKEEKLYNDLFILDSKKEEINLLRKDLVILDNVNKLKYKYNSLDTYKNLLDKQIQNKEIETNKLIISKEKYNTLPQLNSSLEELKLNLNNISSELGIIKTLEDNLKTINNNEIKVKLNNQAITKIEKELIELNKINFNDLLKEIKEETVNNNLIITSYNPAKLVELNSKLEKYNENIKNNNSYNSLLENNNLLCTIIDNLTKEITFLEDDLEKLKSIKTHNILENFIDLVSDNKPCPLCGSITHPKVIEKSDNKVSDKEIELLKDNINKVRLKVSEHKLNVNNNINKINELKLKIDNDLLSIDLNSLKHEIEKEKLSSINYTNAIKNIDLLKKKEDKIKYDNEQNDKLINKKSNDIIILIEQNKTLNEAINELKNKIYNFTNGNDLLTIKTEKEIEVNKITLSINNLNTEINTIKNNYIIINNNLLKIDNSILEQKNNIELTTNQINKFMNENNIDEEIYNIYSNKLNDYNNINNIIKEYDIEHTKITSLINENKDKLKDYTLIDIDILTTKLNEMLAIFKDINEEYDITTNKYNIVNDDYITLEDLNNKNKSTIEKYEIINELYKLSNGTYSKVSKINLQKYVLGIILDKIILYANYYLKSFTSNRYQLKRIIDESSSNRGLDLSVIDAQTGLERSVGSLSGGESFMCALALAIGMSEGISNMNGGIKLENIFIDEGFGSLDNEALDNAIEALMMLAQNGRMIGIISHVSDIKTRITDVITVEKSKNGSKIIIE